MNPQPSSSNGSGPGGPGLVADNISVGYPDRRVIEALSLAVETVQILALVGPNGCRVFKVHANIITDPASGMPVVSPMRWSGTPQTGPYYFSRTPSR
jgi:hypothetical protein